ncbi:hypothetical protein CCHR01_18893 [Colletotrichum chrysophilum]|uniref:Uncharacterized protein n=1 Tax=Colletotrichum chrysophilum TaxID=1836956 RepID=A0AAD8ZZ86_9PEZI|nr:hypothetical protein CCHR01_18893 [Colletotrichum chrysophilum]
MRQRWPTLHLSGPQGPIRPMDLSNGTSRG